MTTPEGDWNEAQGSGELVKWENPGQVVQGIYKGFEVLDGNNNKTFNQYSVEVKDDNGEPIVIKFRGTTDLDAKLDQVSEGDEVRITFVSQKRTTGGNTWKEFKVQFRTPAAA